MKTLGKSLALLATLVALVLCVLIAMDDVLLPNVMRWLDIGTPPVKSDATFVLLGDEDCRPFIAAALYKTGFTKRILLARLKPFEDDPYDLPTHLIARDVLRKRGVAEEDISFLGDGITNTMNESRTLGKFLEENPNATVTVVTSNFHTRRTRWSMRLLFGNDAERLHFVSSPNDDFRFDDWWKNTRGFRLVMMEHMKLLGYWVCYGNALYWLGGMIVGAAGIGYFRRRKNTD